MDVNFIFKHNRLDITNLHRLGIRSTLWLEEVIEDTNTQFFDITAPGDIHPIHFAVGFSKNSQPIKYVFEREGDIIRSLYARLATKDEIKNEFCKFCKE